MKKLWLMLPIGLCLLFGCSSDSQESMQEAETSVSQEQASEKEKTNQVTEQTDEEQAHLEILNDLPEDADPDDWNLILVNNWTPTPENVELNLEEVEPGKSLDTRIVEPFKEWIAASQRAGHQVYFASGYRSVERQQSNYDLRVNEMINDGYSKEEAIAMTNQYTAIPKKSEHHTGLAVDLIDQHWIAQGKAFTPEYTTPDNLQAWFLETMTDYGFILRYPEGAEELTGINFESWHFRYVGRENAEFINNHGLVLEEYIDLLKERAAQ